MRAKVFWFFFSKKNCFLSSYLGYRVFGLGLIATGIVCLISRNFVLSELLPDNFAHRAALAYPAGAFVLLAGAGINWPRTTALAAASIIAVYSLVILCIDLPYVAAHVTEYGSYSNVAAEFAVVSAGLIIYATSANIDAGLAARLIGAGRCTFGVCAILFGGAHFFYMNLTAPLVPKILPPSQEFWGYATGCFHIAGGIAILTGVQARLAAILLTIMYASFTPLVHVPLLLAVPANHFYWTENALNLVLTGAAWVIADSLRVRRVVV